MAAHGLNPPPAASRLLRQLDARIQASPDPFDADCLRAERAVFLARQGAVAEVEAVLADLRQRYDAKPRFAISAWINLCEGMSRHFSDMGPQAGDKMRRAHALSLAAGLNRLSALSAAWCAHMDYLDAAFESMASHLDVALTLADADHHGARARASLVAAQAFHVAGRFDLARPWYEATRHHAVDEGDDATLSALLHNAAWLRATQLRQDVLLLGATAQDSEPTLMSAESTQQFDRLVGACSLQSLTPILRAQILSVLGRPRDAIKLYDDHFDASLAEGVGRTIEADLLADRAWCHVTVGETATARRYAEAAALRLDLRCHCVDRVLAHKRLAQVLVALGEPARAEAQEAATAEAWAGHRQEQQRILTALAGSLAAHPPRSR